MSASEDVGTGPAAASKSQDEPDPVEIAREIALRRLEQRDYSRAELHSYLLRRGTPDEVAEQVLDRLEGVGLVDDVRFAQAWTQSRHSNAKLSRRAIGSELRTKGLDSELIDEALGSIDHSSELQAAEQLGRRKLRSLQGLPNQVAFRRLSGVLARKGYGPSVVIPVVRELLGELEDADPTDPD